MDHSVELADNAKWVHENNAKVNLPMFQKSSQLQNACSFFVSRSA